jgi:EAL domain-containing protein (putative c-di-GMP-specific phosphodiesterase class I)
LHSFPGGRPDVHFAALEDFEHVFYESPLPLLICDRATLRYVAVNEAASELYGYSEMEMSRLALHDIGPPIRTIASTCHRSLHRRRNGSLVYVTMASKATTWKSREALIITVVEAREATDAPLITDLRLAAGRGQFALAYQPMVSAKTGEITGVEALLRWHHPSRGTLLPKHFIDDAERDGRMFEIGEWVLAQACAQAKRWQCVSPGLRMSVNVSACQFTGPALTRQIALALEEADLQPSLLNIEVTETTAIEDIARTSTILRDLKQLGVETTLDDFGTGYSSLSYLKNLPVDALKIDREFISDILTNGADLAITEAIVNLARRLGVRVVAEGVEYAGQRQLLERLGVDEMQGYFFGKPVSAAETDRLLFDDPSGYAAAGG